LEVTDVDRAALSGPPRDVTTMRALVVYESMYGNTRTVAQHVADGLQSRFQVTVVPVEDATVELVAGADLLVVGGPTHVHGLSTGMSRQAAADAAEKDPALTLEGTFSNGVGLREWLATVAAGAAAAAAFDTRVPAPAAFTGRASRGIARRLRDRGFHLAVAPESFLVDKHNQLVAGEVSRAAAWGATLARVVNSTPEVASR
jgi:hypothetical protein